MQEEQEVSTSQAACTPTRWTEYGCLIQSPKHKFWSPSLRIFEAIFREETQVRRVTSTPDPDTFEKYRDTPPISIAILWQKYALLLAESSIYIYIYINPPICITICLPFVSRYVSRSIGARGHWNTPKQGLFCNRAVLVNVLRVVFPL